MSRRAASTGGLADPMQKAARKKTGIDTASVSLRAPGTNATAVPT